LTIRESKERWKAVVKVGLLIVVVFLLEITVLALLDPSLSVGDTTWIYTAIDPSCFGFVTLRIQFMGFNPAGTASFFVGAALNIISMITIVGKFITQQRARRSPI
jgi:hypothetical protein